MLANLGVIFCMSKGVKNITAQQLNDWDMTALIRDAKDAIPKVVATTWLDQHKRGCLPQWAIEQIKVEQMQYAAL